MNCAEDHKKMTGKFSQRQIQIDTQIDRHTDAQRQTDTQKDKVRQIDTNTLKGR